jgi:peptide/nickel transport system substrate-binding protein
VATNYWSGVLQRRINRRRALAATGATGLAAALLAACGGDDGPTRAPLDETGLVTLPKDETKDATPGGIMPWNHGALEFVLDPSRAPSFTSWGMISPVYSAIVKFGKAVGSRPTPADITGDATTGWEVAPDGLSITYKLRPNHKFDPRPPTNGRAMTTQDIKWSYDRTEAVSPLVGAVYRSAGPSGVVESLTVIDNETFQIKLAEPDSAVNELLAYGYIYISPVEAENRFDPRSEARGSGPFRLERFDPGIRAEFRKNPDWYVDGRPFLDGIDKTFIDTREQATLDAQFLAKQLWFSNSQPTDTLRLKDQNPQLLMRQANTRLGPGGYPLNVGTFFANEPRLRRAASMVIDRDTLIEAVYNTNVWTDRGLDVPLIWDGHLSSNGFTWIDPKSEEMGPGAKWFQYNPAEAKKLMDAAGYNNKELIFVLRAAFGPTNLAEVISEMLRNGGFNIRNQAIEANDWRQIKLDGPTRYEGFFWHTANSFNDDGYLVAKYTPSGRDRATDKAIPGITDKILALRKEFDQKRKAEMLRDVQRDLADYMPDIPIVSTQPTLDFQLIWPWMRNTAWTVPGFDQTATTARDYTEYFIDKELQQQYG